MAHFHQHLASFIVPALVLSGTVIYLLLGSHPLAVPIVLATVALGIFKMMRETLAALLKKQFALDYIAIVAIAVALVMGEYLVAAILALMVSSGGALDDYAAKQAKKSLTALVDRIPTDVILWEGAPGRRRKLSEVKVGEEILIRKGEVVALDGTLLSESGETDESSLTGEPYFISKITEDVIRSGTVNVGQPIVVRVTKTEADSTYRKIVDMVKEAENEKSPMVRMAEKYSVGFTIAAFAISAFAYVHSDYDLTRVLAVLAVATPCPLIIATPIALLGGVNAAAKKKIIVKKLAALETLSRVQAIVFDKTGTITLGTPRVSGITLQCSQSINDALSVAEAIERNSLHPLAKAIVSEARRRDVGIMHATDVREMLGKGISGIVNGQEYMLAKTEGEGMSIALSSGTVTQAVFGFEDEIKQQSAETMKHLEESGISLNIFTGDKKAAAKKIAAQLGTRVSVRAECTPQDKQDGISALRREGKITAMVGDGINDAPALALADVGMAFSNEEQTASSEAADIVFLGGDFSMVLEIWEVSKKTVAIAKQSILAGIGMSLIAMFAASLGFISPIIGAALQEVIDIAVIINALRASR